MTNKNRKTEKLSLPNTYNVVLEAKENTSLSTKTKHTLNLQNKNSKLLAEDNAVQKALAEINFIEANETVEKGDLQGAIAKYREAINYFSDNPDYYINLIDTLKKDVKYKAELDILLKDVTGKFPNNSQIKTKLEEFRPLKQEIKYNVKMNFNDKKNTTNHTKQINNIRENETQKKINSTQKIHTKLITNSEKSINTNTSNLTKPDKMVRLRNNVYVLTEGVKKQNPYVKAITVLILILLPIGVFWGLTKSYKETIVETIPISPEPQSSLVLNQLYFCWNSSTDKVDYLFQIEQEGKSVLERYTREKFYLVSQEDAQVIKKNTYSTWRVIPISPKRETLKYKASEGQFMLIDKPKDNES